jgi:hypothetical protein
MLDHRGDHRAPLRVGLERRENGRRVGLGAAGGEHDFGVVRGAEQRLHLHARLLERLADLEPKLWIEEALPNCSVKKGSMASTTAGSQAVVALLSM